MKKISTELLASTVESKRQELKLTKEKLGDLTGINRLQIAKIEDQKFIPSLPQLEKLAEVLDFSISSLFTEETKEDVFLALRGSAKTEEEKHGVEKMISMMLCLRKHELLRKNRHG